MTDRRRLVAAVCMGVCLAAVPGHAYADPAGPTEFRTEVTAVTPATDTIEVTIEGGDSFVNIVVDPGTEVIVLGYDDEPYVLIDTDGTVYENLRSFATYYNSSRYGTDDIPDTVDSAAVPDWERVGSSGTFAWHDHRAHWMGSTKPLGMQPGDSLPPQTITLLVDSEQVDVEVVSTLIAGPSELPVIVGGLLGLALAGLAIALRRKAVAALVASVVALVFGLAQYLSLPGLTGPSRLWWLPPAIAVACSAAALVRRWSSPVVRLGLVVVASVQLLQWTYVRRLTFTRPVLPTDAPFWLDRAASAAVAAAAAVLVGAALAGLWRLVRQAPPARPVAALEPS